MLRGFSPGKQNADLFRTSLGAFLEHGQDQLRDFLQRVEYALSGDGNRFEGRLAFDGEVLLQIRLQIPTFRLSDRQRQSRTARRWDSILVRADTPRIVWAVGNRSRSPHASPNIRDHRKPRPQLDDPFPSIFLRLRKRPSM